MYKKGVIFVSVILICLGFVDIAFGDYLGLIHPDSGIEADTEKNELIYYNDIYEASEPSIQTTDGIETPEVLYSERYDLDNDGLTNLDELRYGTNPYSRDTDNDFVIDSLEVKYGTSPLIWDTDSDYLADYYEMEYNAGSTNAFTDDSDSDGLPDPWEDNDGDGILNIEEQHPKFKYGILGSNPNLVDSDGDHIADNLEIQSDKLGPISTNSINEEGYTQLTPSRGLDRDNAALDVSNKNSNLSRHFKTLGWSDSDLEYWDWGLEQAFKHGVLPKNTSSTVWYHYSPRLHACPADYNWDEGAPYRWNKYDSNPADNDTDGDIMDDNWDPRPLIYDDRLDAYIAIKTITHNGVPYDAEAPTNKNFTGAFNANFSAVELKKGDLITLTLWLGLEDTPSNDPEKIPNEWWKPINISIWFGPFELGADNRSHGDLVADDIRGDDLWPDLNSTALPSVPDKPWVKVDNTNYKDSYTFKNSTGATNTMYFYEQIISIYIPANLPAGIIGFIVRANPNTGENFHYETFLWPFVAY